MARVTEVERPQGDALPVRAVTHRLPAPRQRPHGPVQLAVRPPHGRRLPRAGRGHRHRAQPARAHRHHLRVDALARPRLGRGARPPVRSPRRLPRGGRRTSTERVGPTTATARPRTSRRGPRSGAALPGYDGFCRDRGLEPGDGRALRFRTPDDGVDRLRRRRARARRVREQHARGLRAPPLERHPGLPPGQRGRRPLHADHPRDPRRGPPQRHAEVPPARRRPRPRAPAGVRPPSASSSTSSARSSPSDGTTWRCPTTATGATCPRRCATTWPCSAGVRPTASRSGRSRRSWPCSGSRTSPPRRRSSTPRSSTTSTPSTSGR